VLDVPCGQGRHAHLLAEAGFRVDGLDYSAHLIDRARARGTGPTLKYTRGDMRKLPARWSGRFDAVVNLFTSFGFFASPSDDAVVVQEFARVLAPGGVLVYETFTTAQRAFGRGPKRDAFLLAPEELATLFPMLETQRCEEGVYAEPEPTALARLIARKPA
jgi:SAM-dependent methyltransferase